MARQNRFRISNVPQHVVQRGHNGEPIFRASRDYVVFLESLAEAIAVSQTRVHAYALLPNRVEFLCTPQREDGVSRLMQAVGRRYVPAFNLMHGRTGTLWDGRYRAALVEPTGTVLSVYRYLDTLRPDGSDANAHPHPWTSYRCHINGDCGGLIVDHLMFSRLADTPSVRQRRYRDLCELPLNEGVRADMAEAVLHGLVLGSEGFKERMRTQFGVRTRLGRPGRPPKVRHADSSVPPLLSSALGVA